MSTKSKWALVALVAAIAGFLLASFRVDTDRGSDARIANSMAIHQELKGRSGSVGSEADPGDLEKSHKDNSQSCLAVSQLESHPLLVQDSYRFDAVGDSGPTIAAYRGLTEHDLHGLATQGDSAAMVVLGAMSLMRARDWPVEKAVPYLMHEDPKLMAYSFSRPFSPEFLGHMAQARKWFYSAALHGRVMALHRVGDSLSLEKGGAVGLGWINASEFASLSNYDQIAMIPSNVYNVLSFEVAPTLKSGPHGTLIADLMPRTERQSTIVDRLSEQFSRDLDDAGLPPISVPESTAPKMDDLLGLLCESELDRLKRGDENVR